MSDPVRIALVGATGLVGRRVIEASIGRDDVHIVAISRREMKFPDGAKLEMILADPSEWDTSIAIAEPDVVICALGTTIRKVGGDEAAFRAVDHDLVLSVAEAAKNTGVRGFVVISSVGAAARSKNFYLSVKGQMEDDLRKLKFKRLDILRPGLLRGSRQNDIRPAEQLGKMIAPLADVFLRGGMAQYRSIDARTVAEAALDCATTKAAGRCFIHDHEAILRAARRFST